MLMLFATDYVVSEPYIRAPQFVLRNVFDAISNPTERANIRVWTSHVLQGFHISEPHLRMLVSAMQGVNAMKRNYLMSNVCLLSQYRQWSIDSFVQLIKTLSSKKPMDERKCYTIFWYVMQNLSPYLISLEGVEYVFRVLRHVNTDEIGSIVEGVQILLGNDRFQIRDDQLDLRGLIQVLASIAQRDLAELVSAVNDMVQNRTGSLNDLCYFMNALKNLQHLSLEGVMENFQRFCKNRQGSLRALAKMLKMIDTFNATRNREGLNNLNGIDINMSLEEILDFLLPLLQEQQEERHDHAVQVHNEAALYMTPIWNGMTEALQKNHIRLMTIEACDAAVHQWIDELGNLRERDQIFALLGNRQGIKKMHQFLSHERFKKALNTLWNNLKEGLKGQEVWQTAVTFCQNHPEHRQAFLFQGLWDAITAFSVSKGKDGVSCIEGIAERFLMWARGLFDIKFLDDITRSIYEDPKYSFFINIDEASNLKERYEALTTYEAFKDQVKEGLLALKPIFMERFQNQFDKKLIERFFETDKIKSMFTFFDDERDIATQGRLRRAFERLKE